MIPFIPDHSFCLRPTLYDINIAIPTFSFLLTSGVYLCVCVSVFHSFVFNLSVSSCFKCVSCNQSVDGLFKNPVASKFSPFTFIVIINVFEFISAT